MKQLKKTFDFNGSDEAGLDLLRQFNILKEKLQAFLEADSREPILKHIKRDFFNYIKAELSSLVDKEQCLNEATRLAGELAYQKNANRALGQTMKTTEAEVKRLKEALDESPTREGVRQLQNIIKAHEEQQRLTELDRKKELEGYQKERRDYYALRKKITEVEQSEYAQQRRVAEEATKRAEDEKKRSQSEQGRLKAQLAAQVQMVAEGKRIIRQCEADMEDNTRAYRVLEAEAEAYRRRGDYLKALCKEAHTLTLAREEHSMRHEDKASQHEHWGDKTGLDETRMQYVNSITALEKIRDANYAHGSSKGELEEPEREDREEVEALQLEEAIRRSQAEQAPVEASARQQATSDADLAQAIKRSQEETYSVHPDPEIEALLRLSRQYVWKGNK